MSLKKIDFSELNWESSAPGSRFKSFETDAKKIRLVEIVRTEGEEADWCQNGHIGYVIEGELEIKFKDETIKYKSGDGLVIGAGELHQHRPIALTDLVRLFLVED